MTIYKVTTKALNIRRTGVKLADNSNVIRPVHKGDLISCYGKLTKTGWSRCLIDQNTRGYVALELALERGWLRWMPNIRAAYLFSQRMVTPDSKSRRYSLTSKSLPIRRYRIIDFLDVEHSDRYQEENGKTYCNVYAHDFCYLAGVYLPRVWWSEYHLDRMRESNQFIIAPEYGVTVFEQSANAIYDWLCTYGYLFGWQRVETANDAQRLVNGGRVGVVSGKNKTGRSGHITVILPETDEHEAEYFDGVCVGLLQSQAGYKNYKVFTSGWYVMAEFAGSHGFFVNEGE